MKAVKYLAPMLSFLVFFGCGIDRPNTEQVIQNFKTKYSDVKVVKVSFDEWHHGMVETKIRYHFDEKPYELKWYYKQVGGNWAPEHQEYPKHIRFGSIDTKERAVEVAEKVLFEIYGKENIERQKPYKVQASGFNWQISGTLPEESVGGVFSISLSGSNGSVLHVEHTK